MARQTRRSIDSNGVRQAVEERSKSPTVLRCAIYTRKSTVEGLDQAFNSLDAQREAAEFYIASQIHLGWVVLKDRYDDGGFSGGSMDRPAVARLMADVKAGLIDCVVVYKVDRLSRSLLDFARMMQVFENKGVHFVSVTQHFNTAESMGRLTLNILLSFAQFEREIISERTRDKIAAARKRGQWVGGRPILGYDLDRANHKLVVNPKEAEQVRAIFKLYLKERTLLKTATELNKRGWHTKAWTDSKGRKFGNLPFVKNQISSLLGNVAYLGKVRHRDQVHDGQHDAIVDDQTWTAVQALLDRNHRTAGSITRNRYGAPLKGLLRCRACDAAMIHSPVSKGAKKTKQYRYYVCTNAQKRGYDQCPNPSVRAAWIEEQALRQVRSIEFDAKALDVAGLPDPKRHDATPEILGLLIEHVNFDAKGNQIVITLTPTAARCQRRANRKESGDAANSQLVFSIEQPNVRPNRRHSRGNTTHPAQVQPILRSLVLAHQIEAAIRDGRAHDFKDLARQMGISDARIGQIVGLCQLAPTIQEQILNNQPTAVHALCHRQIGKLAEIVDWEEQRRCFNLKSPLGTR